MKAVRRIDTTDAAVDKTVERLIRRGFSWNERVLRPHEVVVRRLIAE
jgi:molecular chaperone GrpE (heat shock protein)